MVEEEDGRATLDVTPEAHTLPKEVLKMFKEPALKPQERWFLQKLLIFDGWFHLPQLFC